MCFFLFQQGSEESCGAKMEDDMATKDSTVKVYDFDKFLAQESMTRDFPGSILHIFVYCKP